MNTARLRHKINFSITVNYIKRPNTFCQPVTGTIPVFQKQQTFSYAVRFLFDFQGRISSDTIDI
jgi:hypothetical protein